jgi:hypothetical protein
VDQQDLINNLRASHTTKQSHRTVTFLPHRVWSYITADVMWKSPRLEMYEAGKADSARHLELDSARKSNATSCSSRPVTYKESVITMTRMFNDALSMLEIRFFDVSRMKPGCTSSIRDKRGLSSCTRLQD